MALSSARVAAEQIADEASFASDALWLLSIAKMLD